MSASSTPRTSRASRALLSPAPLERFFSPRVVAVVGATDDDGRQSTHAWRQLLAWGARVGARVVPVNPRRAGVDGVATVADIASVGEAVDVVAALTADPLPVARAAAAANAGFLVVFAAGFAETGTDGRARQHELLAALAGSATRLIGPNTNLNAFEPLDASLPGPGLALLTQSGHQGRPLYLLQRSGVRVSYWAPTGNEADLDAADFLDWFATRPDVGAVAAYLEGIPDGRRFLGAASRARDAGTPVVTVKVGRSDAGARAASSHTGALAGSDRVADAAFRSVGIARVGDLDDLADTATFLARAPAPRAGGVAVYAMSGGTCSLLADQMATAGLALPRLGASTRSGLRDLVPGYLPVDNPVDCGGPPMADERGRRVLELLAADPGVGCVVAAVSGPVPPFTDRLVEDLLAVASAHPELAWALVWGSPNVPDARLTEAITSPQLAVFRSGRAAATALAAWHRWHAGRRRHSVEARGTADAAAQVDAPPPSAAEAWPTLAEASEWSARGVIAGAGLRVARAVLIGTPDDAGAALDAVGGTAVLKADVAGLAHRAQHGLVADRVDSAADAHRLASELLARAASIAPGRVRGVVVAAQAPPGPDVLVGAVWDRSFGPVVTVGHGGGDTELIDRTAVGLAPLSTSAADRLLREVPGSARWQACGPKAWAELCEAVSAIGDLAATAGPSLGALECNPVRLVPEGAVVLDTWGYRQDR